ncbi:putative baseplate assembly protein [Streptomyces catenulae]|uniref:Baseplate assembly protein n=1 Tax=Streptomyces catenulae TaxID=66875 RepID=A0ABV2YTC2_9ACTN|nr:putative baseplate assembly protein [Streptomyces catenulae]
MSRRERIRQARRNGVDAVEVAEDGRTLTVTFLGKAPHGLRPENVRIDGGRRITGIEALEITVEREEDPELDDRLVVTVDRTGDFSVYRLSVVETDPYGRPGTEPFRGFDQRYFRAEFSFRPDCPSPFDCADGEGGGVADRLPEAFRPPAPVIDYTARDYGTLRQVVLDRLRLTTPEWLERNPADLGTTLVELLAYTADQISYQQDAVATEAYLDTARLRTSVRRHVRLIDYPMHDGCTARAFVTVAVAAPLTLPPGTFRFAAVDHRADGPRDRPRLGPVIDDRELAGLAERGSLEVFEPVVRDAPLALLPGHNAVRLWTWGGEVCGLPRGATAATLTDGWADEEGGARELAFAPGDLLLFEEVRGPRTGTPGDQDPTHRQVVRLTSVTPAVDRLVGQPVLEVTWAAADALTFPLRLTVRGGRECAPVEDVSVARGNVVLVDHGRSPDGGEGHVPEALTVPTVPAVLPSCGPPAFGCPDGGHGGNEVAQLLGGLIDRAEGGRELTPDDVRRLFAAVGTEAAERAGIGLESAGQRTEQVVPGTAYAQAAAVRALLAQSVYPGIGPRFRPVLGRAPVVQAVPFPQPRQVAAGQAERLAAIPERVRERLVELWRGARDRDGLDEAEIAELTVLFGPRKLAEVDPARHPVRALRELLHRSPRLLDGKLRRLAVLAARARAGTVLDGRTAWEIAHTWGAEYAVGLHPDEPVLHGPAAAVRQDPREALPALHLREERADGAAGDGGAAGAVWLPRRDLLGSGPRDRHLVGELTDDGRLALRFGDGHHGARPTPGGRLVAHYRIGGGTAGNVGAESIGHLVLRCDPEEPGADGPPPRPAVLAREVSASVAGVRNPLPAVGGTEPEPLEQVRQLAPLDLRRTRLRAVTARDYAALAGELPGVQRAAAEIRWTGSVQEAHVAVDAYGTGEPSPALLDAVGQALEGYRRIGHDLVVQPARWVPLDVALSVCAEPGHQHGQILAELYRVLGGRAGFFHPDALTFGEPVRLSGLVAVAAAVPGVRSVVVTRLRRMFHADRGEREAGVVRLGPLEIARCDNDPDRPENGRLVIEFGGGR